MAKINYRLKFILPIVLAFLIPLLGILANDFPQDATDLLQKWAPPSFLILTIWYTILVIRQWKSKKKDWINLGIILGAVGIFLTVYGSFIGFNHQQSSNWVLAARISFISLIIYMIQQVILTQEKISNLLLEKEQLQSENLKVQLKELRNQMDPHFFFNSLNTLRSMVRQNHANSEQFIIGLSDFYRQILKHQKNTTLTLVEELSVLKSYLFLMKNRNEQALHTELEGIDKIYDQYEIPTLALQSVVENCFKHNVMSSKMPLAITIRTTDDAYIEVINKLQPKLSPPETSGLGLDLLKKRYQLLKIDQGLIVEAKEDTFSVKLKLIPSQ